MSLSLDPAFSVLKDHYVVGWKNINGKKWVGTSYGCDQPAVGMTNGAGPGNMQMFMLSPDGIVLHCLPGFWHPEDLEHELQMGRVLHRLWKSKSSTKAKRTMFKRIQLQTMRNLPRAMVTRSGWQGFDAANERNRLKMLKTGRTRDTFFYKDGKPTRFKPTSTVVHERMAARPFVRFSRFDTAMFVDYGRKYYDNNQRVDEYYGKKPKEQKSKASMTGKRAYKAKRPQEKGKKKRPTSRPTSRPTRKR